MASHPSSHSRICCVYFCIFFTVMICVMSLLSYLKTLKTVVLYFYVHGGGVLLTTS